MAWSLMVIRPSLATELLICLLLFSLGQGDPIQHLALLSMGKVQLQMVSSYGYSITMVSRTDMYIVCMYIYIYVCVNHQDQPQNHEALETLWSIGKW